MKKTILLLACALLLAGCSGSDLGMSVTGSSSVSAAGVSLSQAAVPTVPAVDSIAMPTFAPLPTLPSMLGGGSAAPTMEIEDISISASDSSAASAGNSSSGLTFPDIPNFSIPAVAPLATPNPTAKPAATKPAGSSAASLTVVKTTTANSVPPAAAPTALIKTPAATAAVVAPVGLAKLVLPGAPELAIVEQPAGQPNYVSTAQNTVTRFAEASAYGVTGLLAHNSLAGVYFATLKVGDAFSLVDSAGQASTYQVQAIQSYQALTPDSTSSSFVDLASGQTYTASQLFGIVYSGSDQVTLQTCIEKDSNGSWGRLFVIAKLK